MSKTKATEPVETTGAAGESTAPAAPAKPAKAKTEVETVTMLNGEVVEFAGKKRLIKTMIEQNGKPGVKLQFRNGETRVFLVPDSLLLKFAAHGASQKFGDEIAGVEDLDDALLAVDELNDRIQKGEWGAERAAGSGANGASILAKALIDVSGKSAEDIRGFLSTKTPAEKLALRGSEKLKAVVARLEAEKAAKAKPKAAVNTDALLEGLGI